MHHYSAASELAAVERPVSPPDVDICHMQGYTEVLILASTVQQMDASGCEVMQMDDMESVAETTADDTTPYDSLTLPLQEEEAHTWPVAHQLIDCT